MKKLTNFIFFCLVNFFATAMEMPEVEKKLQAEQEIKIPQEQLDIIPLMEPQRKWDIATNDRQVQQVVVDSLSLNENDPILGISFGEILNSINPEETFFIIAQTTTEPNGIISFDNFEAYDLLATLQQSKAQMFKPLNVREVRHPVSKQPILSIKFFEFIPGQKTAHYFGSSYDLFETTDDKRKQFVTGVLEANKPKNFMQNPQNDPIERMRNKLSVATTYYNLQKYLEGIPYYKQLINQKIYETGRLGGNAMLGQYYYYGHGVEKDYQKARPLLEQAAAQTIHPWSQAIGLQYLGLLYLNGLAGEKDVPRAIAYLESVADQTANKQAQAEAQDQLGMIYYYGSEGIPQNFPLARSYFQNAAQQSTHKQQQTIAQKYLGKMYYGGEGIEKNYAYAAIYLTPVADQNQLAEDKVEAQEILSNIFYNGGYGIDKDYSKAARYYQALTKQDLDKKTKAKSQLALGLLYMKGMGIEQDYDKAERYLVAAALQTVNPLAQENAQKLLKLLQTKIPQAEETQEEPPSKRLKEN